LNTAATMRRRGRVRVLKPVRRTLDGGMLRRGAWCRQQVKSSAAQTPQNRLGGDRSNDVRDAILDGATNGRRILVSKKPDAARAEESRHSSRGWPPFRSSSSPPRVRKAWLSTSCTRNVGPGSMCVWSAPSTVSCRAKRGEPRTQGVREGGSHQGRREGHIHEAADTPASRIVESRM
jgi:hypothetical protein